MSIWWAIGPIAYLIIGVIVVMITLKYDEVFVKDIKDNPGMILLPLLAYPVIIPVGIIIVAINFFTELGEIHLFSRPTRSLTKSQRLSWFLATYIITERPKMPSMDAGEDAWQTFFDNIIKKYKDKK